VNTDYERIERAIQFIRSNVKTQPNLDDIASHVGLSPFHLQRLFRRWAGVSPKRFLQYLTVSHAKKMLQESNSVLDVSYDLGLTSAGRLHDQFVSIEAISPGEFKTGGESIQIHYGIHDSPFGQMFLAQTDRGICALSFVNHETVHEEIDMLRKRWPKARISKDPSLTGFSAEKIFNHSSQQNEQIYLAVQGTNFQINVWKALLKIPSGCITSYQQIARLLGKPKASRAVATAIAANPVGFLIPCHRVLRSCGDFGEYHWGMSRKQAMVAWEVAKHDACSDNCEKKAKRDVS
jgi:AraC family transcriptional regulator of adaptative response/methylated-DNA-[protein]-cysteine methyltransferase